MVWRFIQSLMLMVTLSGISHAQQAVTFATNWKAQAAHGGFYQAVADGTYKKYGLEVTIRQGGPQVNNRPLLPARRIDFLMTGNLLHSFDNVKNGIPVTVVAAMFQKDPKRSIPTAYIAGILTLVALAMGVMFFAGGSGDWTQLANINDPLPQAMKMIVGESSGWLHMLVWLGLFGLVASFHGIIMGYSRQIFALSREAYLPA